MRKTLILLGLAFLLLVPAIVVAQDDIADIIELVFTDGGAQVGISDTIESVASVTIEVNGQRYLMKVPITVDIDATVPLTSSLVTVPSAARVGQFAVEILDISEYTEETAVSLSGYYEGRTEKYEPSSDDNKIVVVNFDITNVGTEKETLEAYYAQGVDDTGRLFDEIKFICDEVNPGDTGHCVMVFDVLADVDIVALDLEVSDRRQIPIPK